MIIKDKIKDEMPIVNWNSYYVVADFDKTITNGNSKTSWSILAGSDLVPKEYIEDRDAYYKIYRPIELDESMDPDERREKVKEWFRLHIELFVKYKISEEVFEIASRDLRIMEFRPGAKEFIEFLHKMNIPLVIISAGLGNFIECFLRNNGVYYDNIYVASNKIIFENGEATGVGDNIIHSLNKNEVSIPDDIKRKLEGRDRVLLLGDQKSDLLMVDEASHEKVIKIGLLTKETVDLKDSYVEDFDIVLNPEESYEDLINMII